MLLVPRQPHRNVIFLPVSFLVLIRKRPPPRPQIEAESLQTKIGRAGWVMQE